MNKILQHNIKKYLRNQGKELKDLYKMLGISKSSYHSRVSGNFSRDSIQEIADALGCSVPELLIEPCKKIVDVDCANEEPVVTNLIECPNCGQKLFVHAINDIK